MTPRHRRVKFDFEVDFTNGGGIQGQDFRLDIDGDDISDRELAAHIVRDMRLLMVGEVRIRNKEIIVEPHKRQSGDVFVDLSHTIEDGLITYKGLPAPVICDYLSRAASRDIYEPGTEFQIGMIEMVTNTGTYIDCPFHRYEHGKDTSQMPIDAFANLDAIVIRADHRQSLAVDASFFAGKPIRAKAVLVHTGWDVYWNTQAYFHEHPYLTEDAAEYLRSCGVRLVGIDSLNIDDTRVKSRPVHSCLLAADILIVEHMCNLDQLPDRGFRFSAVPPKFKGVGTFPVRAMATLSTVLPEAGGNSPAVRCDDP
jgi:kynurenine formamidase